MRSLLINYLENGDLARGARGKPRPTLDCQHPPLHFLDATVHLALLCVQTHNSELFGPLLQTQPTAKALKRG
jgi:hypothetical protein